MAKHKLPPGPGRPAGIPNKATMNAREAIAAFVDGNAPRLTEWLEQIAAKDGPKAEAVASEAETEHPPTGNDQSEKSPQVTVN